MIMLNITWQKVYSGLCINYILHFISMSLDDKFIILNSNNDYYSHAISKLVFSRLVGYDIMISLQIIDISFECNIPLVFEEHLQLDERHGDLIKNAKKSIFV